MRLNLGCSDRRIDGFIGVDIAPGPAVDEIADLEGPWPWPDSSVLEVRAHDVAEHIGDCSHMVTFCTQCRDQWMRMYRAIYGEDGERKAAAVAVRHPLGRIHFMNELHRVLAPGGTALVEVPSAAHGVGFITDPTHKTPWCLSLFKYFEAGTFAHQRLAKSYGITAAFRVLNLQEVEVSGEDPRERVWKIMATMEAIK
jgi:hypothetical protein